MTYFLARVAFAHMRKINNMPLPIVFLSAASLFLFSLYALGGRNSSGFTSSVTNPSERYALSNGTGVQEDLKRGVVILTAASFEKLEDFKEVEGFYQKVWDNRMDYADAHGNFTIFRNLI